MKEDAYNALITVLHAALILTVNLPAWLAQTILTLTRIFVLQLLLWLQASIGAMTHNLDFLVFKIALMVWVLVFIILQVEKLESSHAQLCINWQVTSALLQMKMLLHVLLDKWKGKWTEFLDAILAKQGKIF